MFVKNVLPPTGKRDRHDVSAACGEPALTKFDTPAIRLGSCLCKSWSTSNTDACSFCPVAAALIENVYGDHKDEDGFLYITYSGENTFGHQD